MGPETDAKGRRHVLEQSLLRSLHDAYYERAQGAQSFAILKAEYVYLEREKADIERRYNSTVVEAQKKAKEIERVDGQMRVLATSLGRLLASMGIIRRDMPATGPELIAVVEGVIANEKAKAETLKVTLPPANPDELKRLTDENADLQRKLAAAERSSLLHSDSQRQAMAKVRDLERDLSNARADSHALGSVANFAERISIMACMCALTSASAQAPECLTCEARRILGKNAIRPSGTAPAPLNPTD